MLDSQELGKMFIGLMVGLIFIGIVIGVSAAYIIPYIFKHISVSVH